MKRTGEGGDLDARSAALLEQNVLWLEVAMQHLLAPQEAQAHQHLVCKLPDEPQTDAFEVAGLDVVIPAQPGGDYQPSKPDTNLMLCTTASTHFAQVQGTHVQLPTTCTVNNIIQLGCGVDKPARKQGQGRVGQATTASKQEDDAGKQVGPAGLDLQVNGKQLKGDAQVASEGQALPDMHHTAAPISVLHVHHHNSTLSSPPPPGPPTPGGTNMTTMVHAS